MPVTAPNIPTPATSTTPNKKPDKLSAGDRILNGLKPSVANFFTGGLAGLFGGNDQKRIYPKIKFNPDGSVIPAKNIDQNKNYRKAASLAQAFQAFLPALTKSSNDANAATREFDTAQQLDLLQRFGGDYARVNTENDRIAQLGQGETKLQLQGLDKLADPEFYRLRAGIGEKGSALLDGQDPNSLTEQEIANLERTNNRNNVGQGTSNTGSNLAALKAGMTFGDRLQTKRNTLSATLQSLGTIAPNLRTGTINSSPSGAGTAAAQIGGTFAGGSQGNLSQSLMGQNTSNMQQTAQIQAAKVPAWQQAVGAIPDY